uniref:Putative secreted protein n=1 Tax=Amblyomma cajennense TaxID=34607 RepID=A0A023FE60_AMBCJ
MALLRFAAFSLAFCILAGLAAAKNLDSDVPDSESSDTKKLTPNHKPDALTPPDIDDPKERDSKEDNPNGPMYPEYWSGPLYRGARGYAPYSGPFYDPFYYWSPYGPSYPGYRRFDGPGDGYPVGPSDESDETEEKKEKDEPEVTQ